MHAYVGSGHRMQKLLIIWRHPLRTACDAKAIAALVWILLSSRAYGDAAIMARSHHKILVVRLERSAFRVPVTLDPGDAVIAGCRARRAQYAKRVI